MNSIVQFCTHLVEYLTHYKAKSYRLALPRSPSQKPEIPSCSIRVGHCIVVNYPPSLSRESGGI